MTPKRHAIAKEIIKLLYPGSPSWIAFSFSSPCRACPYRSLDFHLACEGELYGIIFGGSLCRKSFSYFLVLFRVILL